MAILDTLSQRIKKYFPTRNVPVNNVRLQTLPATTQITPKINQVTLPQKTTTTIRQIPLTPVQKITSALPTPIRQIGQDIKEGLVGRGQEVDIAGNLQFDTGLLGFFRPFGIGKPKEQKVIERNDLLKSLVSNGTITRERASQIAINVLRPSETKAIREGLPRPSKIQLTPEEKKAIRPVVIEEAVDQIFGGLDFVSMGTLKPITKTTARKIAKSQVTGEIYNLLKKEIPDLSDNALNTFSKILTKIDDADDVQSVLNKTNFALQEARKAKVIPEVPKLPQVTDNLAQEARKYKTAEEFVNSKISKDYVSEVRKTTVNDIAKVGTYGEAGSAKTSARRKLASDITNKEIEIAQRDQKLFDTNKNKTIEQLQNEITETKKWADENNTSYPRSIQVKEEIIKTKSQLTDIWNKANKNNADDALINEAKKYKSAEEFVKAQNKTATGAKVTDTLKFYTIEDKDLGQIYRQSGLKSSAYPADFTAKNDIPELKIKKGDKVSILANNEEARSFTIENIPERKTESGTYSKSAQIGDLVDGYSRQEQIDFINKNFSKESLTKSQLTDIWNKANKNNADDALINEARKYKSAEEFVKAQGTPVYHGTALVNAENIDKTGFSLKQQGYSGKPIGASNKGEYISLSKKQSVSELHAIGSTKDGKGGTVLPVFIDKNAKIFSTKDIPKDWVGKNPTLTQLDVYARTHGFDGIDLAKLEDDGIIRGGRIGVKESEVDIFNTDILKTKSQLTDIWNKAQEVKPEPEAILPKKVTEVDRLIASGDIRVKSVNGTDVYQYKKGNEWVNARNEDSAVAQVTKPKVSKAVQLPEELVYKKIDIDLREQELKENPLNNLVKYSAKRGDMKGRLPEVLGEGKSKFGRKGDQIVTEELSNLDITSEEARDAFEDFMARKEALQMEKDQVKREISAFREQAKLAQQKTSEIKPQAQIREEVELAQQEYTALQGQKQAPTTPQKVSSYKDNTTKLIERKKVFETEMPKIGFFGKLKQSLSPVDFLDETSKMIYKNWSRSLEKAKVLGDEQLKTFKIPPKNSWQTILDYQAGKQTPFTNQIKQRFDDLFKEAEAKGLEIGYKEKYLPQVYKESAEEIKAKITNYLLDNGMSKEAILDYQNGKKLTGDIARRLKLNPFFSKEKVFPDYKTAMEYGLTPKYKDINQLIAHYKKELETTVANRNLIENLIDTNKLLLVDDAPSSWKPVELPFSTKGYYADPRLAKVLNGLFGEEKGFLDTIFSVTASASRRAQEISLSAGIPYTDINFFSLGQLIKELTSGNFKATIPFVRANFGKTSADYFNANRKYLKMMADEGLKLGDHIGTLGNTYKNMARKKGFWESVGVNFDKAFNEKTFASFMPQLYTQTFKDIYSKGLKSGLSEKEASRLAGETVRKAFGLIEDLGRSRKTEDKLSAIFFAPKFREGVVNTLKNTGQAGFEFAYNVGGIRKPLDPALSKNRALLAGMAITYAIYNAINYSLNGNFMWDNPENRKFALQIPRKGGELVYVEFMPSFLAFARNILSGTFNLATGDVKGATQKLGSLFSMPVKTTTEVVANKDYFGNKIYEDDDSALIKAGKIAKYVGLSVNHPYIKEIMNQLGDKKPLYQSAVSALELPIKFSSVQKVARSKEFAGTLTLEDIKKSTLADIESGKIDVETAKASYLGKKKKIAESNAKVRLELPFEEYKKSLADDLTNGLITVDDAKKEYLKYKKETEQQKKREELMKEVYPDRNLKELIIDYAKAYKTDPVIAWKAMTTKEKLNEAKGNKVTLQRFFGKHYLDKEEGSEEYMKKEFKKLGISWKDRENYNLEHIVPLTAGGDNSPNNLQIISRDLHNSYTKVDIKAGNAVESGRLSRREVARIMKQLKIDKTISVNEAINML